MVIAGAVVRAVAEGRGWSPPGGLTALAGDAGAALDLGVAIPPALAGPEFMGQLYEAALAPDARSAGAHYTPADVAERLAGLVIPDSDSLLGGDGGPGTVWDPACGGGAFLLAAADALLKAGHGPDEIVADMLWGTDLDPSAVAVAEAALRMWGNLHGVDVGPGDHLAVADALLDRSAAGPLARAERGGFDVVLGNPPFQGQMAGPSVRTTSTAAALRERFGADVVLPYTDTSALFLVAGSEALAPGGRLAMILPTSVLSARDAAMAREQATRNSTLTGLWLAGELVFDAAVHVCAVLLTRTDGTDSGPVARWRGRDFEPVGSDSGHTVGSGRSGRGRRRVSGGAGAGPEAWARLALPCLGVPDPEVRTAGVLGSLGAARAGFREEYYGLVDHVREAPDPATSLHDLQPSSVAALVTAGLIDPGHCWWGEREVQFARQRYLRPVVDLHSLAAAGGRAALWAAALAVPKVVVATQTKVGEAAVDERGRWVASTPTVAFLASADQLWKAAAVICSPVGSVAALAHTAGGARSLDAIRHSVASVSALPLPVDADAWSTGADALRHRDREAFLAAMASAYAVAHPDELHDWWCARAPWPD